jgi:hypothetical protein
LCKHLLTRYSSTDPSDIKAIGAHIRELKKAHSSDGKYSKPYQKKDISEEKVKSAQNEKDERNIVAAHGASEEQMRMTYQMITELAKKIEDEELLHSSRKAPTDKQEMIHLKKGLVFLSSPALNEMNTNCFKKN